MSTCNYLLSERKGNYPSVRQSLPTRMIIVHHHFRFKFLESRIFTKTFNDDFKIWFQVPSLLGCLWQVCHFLIYIYIYCLNNQNHLILHPFPFLTEYGTYIIPFKWRHYVRTLSANFWVPVMPNTFSLWATHWFLWKFWHSDWRKGPKGIISAGPYA